MQRDTALQRESLSRATHGQSMANFSAIFAGFEAKGIPFDLIKPRENVFTFAAWKALGRSVRKGEHGVKVLTWIPIAEVKDEATGEVRRKAGKRCKIAYVFHVSQTEPLGERRGKAPEIGVAAPEVRAASPETVPIPEPEEVEVAQEIEASVDALTAGLRFEPLAF